MERKLGMKIPRVVSDKQDSFLALNSNLNTRVPGNIMHNERTSYTTWNISSIVILHKLTGIRLILYLLQLREALISAWKWQVRHTLAFEILNEWEMKWKATAQSLSDMQLESRTFFTLTWETVGNNN